MDPAEEPDISQAEFLHDVGEEELEHRCACAEEFLEQRDLTDIELFFYTCGGKHIKKEFKPEKNPVCLRIGGMNYFIEWDENGVFARTSLSDPIYLGKTREEFLRKIRRLKIEQYAPQEVV